MTLTENLRKIRVSKKMSQEEVASVLDTTQQQYSKIELGKADISGEKLILLSAFS